MQKYLKIKTIIIILFLKATMKNSNKTNNMGFQWENLFFMMMDRRSLFVGKIHFKLSVGFKAIAYRKLFALIVIANSLNQIIHLRFLK